MSQTNIHLITYNGRISTGAHLYRWFALLYCKSALPKGYLNVESNWAFAFLCVSVRLASYYSVNISYIVTKKVKIIHEFLAELS